MRRPSQLTIMLLPVLVAACLDGNTTGPVADVERQSALIEAIEAAGPGDVIDLASVLEAPGADILTHTYASKGEAYRAIGAALQTDENGVWPGEGGGTIIFLGRNDTFIAWFGLPASVADLCLTETTSLDDMTVRVVTHDHGGRRLSADGAVCDAVPS